MAIACYGFDNQTGIGQLLDSNVLFWLKYVLLSSALASAGALFSVWFRKNVSFSFDTSLKIDGRLLRIIAIAAAVVLLLLHFVRIFNFDFWGDEAFSIKLARTSVSEMLRMTASDVHPPLYYLILMAANRLFGDEGWVYNFVSLVPYVAMLVLSLTVVWKRFGGAAAAILMTCLAFMNSAITYNVEVRMYSWAALFSLVAYLWLLKVLERGSPSDWVVFCLASLAAAYTHYYALLLVAFFYCGLIVLAIARRVAWRRVLGACVVTAVGYIPWLAVLLGALERTSESYWMTDIPTLEESVRWLFDLGNGAGGTTTLLVLVFVLVLLVFILRRTGVVGIAKQERGWAVCVSGRLTALDDEAAWVLVGVGSALAVIVTGLLISEVVRPMFALRYLYPAAVIAWLLLGVLSSRFGAKGIVPALLVLLILHAGLPSYQEQRRQEEAVWRIQEQTVEAMAEVEEGDVLLSDITHLSWSVLDAYFPGTRSGAVDTNIPIKLEGDGRRTWLVLSGDLTDDQNEWVASSGFEAVEVCHEGNLGEHVVHAYRLDPMKEGDGR